MLSSVIAATLPFTPKYFGFSPPNIFYKSMPLPAMIAQSFLCKVNCLLLFPKVPEGRNEA